MSPQGWIPKKIDYCIRLASIFKFTNICNCYRNKMLSLYYQIKLSFYFCSEVQCHCLPSYLSFSLQTSLSISSPSFPFLILLFHLTTYFAIAFKLLALHKHAYIFNKFESTPKIDYNPPIRNVFAMELNLFRLLPIFRDQSINTWSRLVLNDRVQLKNGQHTLTVQSTQ